MCVNLLLLVVHEFCTVLQIVKVVLSVCIVVFEDRFKDSITMDYFCTKDLKSGISHILMILWGTFPVKWSYV